MIEEIYRREYGRVLATLIRLLGDFDVAEDALQDAFAAALAQWPRDGEPNNPAAWLVSTARFKAIDRMRKRAVAEAKSTAVAFEMEHVDDEPKPVDTLRLIFTCCHPALAREARTALTLRTVCGLDVDAIAHAFLIPRETLQQRLVRAKHKIKAAKIAYEVPTELGERLASVLEVIYLVFNAGYSTFELSSEALRLGRLLVELMPGEPEAKGLLALMLFHHARRMTRIDDRGDLVTLEEQDRTKWDRRAIEEGAQLVEAALRGRGYGAYSIEAAIAALHAQAESSSSTDWPQIASLYSVLLNVKPTAVVELNRAIAIAMADGYERGLALLDDLAPRLPGYHLLPAARADLLRRLGRNDEAARAYGDAIALVSNDVERRFLERRLRDVGGGSHASGHS